MKYDAPIKMGPMEFTSMEMVVMAALVPIAIAVLVGLRRETAVIAGVLCALAMMATR
ncbi:MAG: hypothetical protein AAF526_06740 [Pseudomonadota bacterium]